jgi:hypothetical protein
VSFLHSCGRHYYGTLECEREPNPVGGFRGSLPLLYTSQSNLQKRVLSDSKNLAT